MSEHWIIRIPKPKKVFKFLRRHATIIMIWFMVMLINGFIIMWGWIFCGAIPNTILKVDLSVHYLIGFITAIPVAIWNFWNFWQWRQWRKRRQT